MFLQDRAHDSALDAFAATVNDTDFIDAGVPALLDIFLYHTGNILGRKGMQVDGIFYRKDNRLAEGRIGFRLVIGFH